MVIRLRGTVNMYHDVAASFERLGLLRRYAATIVPSTDDYIGLLRKAARFRCLERGRQGVIADRAEEPGESSRERSASTPNGSRPGGSKIWRTGGEDS